MAEDLITPREAALAARVSSKTILRLAAGGEFDSIRVGRQAIRIRRSSFLRWLWGEDWREVVGEEPTPTTEGARKNA